MKIQIFLEEVLERIKSLNPGWQPRNFLVNFSMAEIAAIEKLCRISSFYFVIGFISFVIKCMHCVLYQYSLQYRISKCKQSVCLHYGL